MSFPEVSRYFPGILSIFLNNLEIEKEEFLMSTGKKYLKEIHCLNAESEKTEKFEHNKRKNVKKHEKLFDVLFQWVFKSWFGEIELLKDWENWVNIKEFIPKKKNENRSSVYRWKLLWCCFHEFLNFLWMMKGGEHFCVHPKGNKTLSDYTEGEV